MCCAKKIVFGRFLIMDCLIHMFEHCLMSYRTVWVDETSSFFYSSWSGELHALCAHLSRLKRLKCYKVQTKVRIELLSNQQTNQNK